MANPTFLDIFGAEQTAVQAFIDIMPNLGNTYSDARLAAHQIIKTLKDMNDNYAVSNSPLASYSVTKEAENIDIDTQRQTFTFTFEMKLEATAVEDEPA